MDETLVARGYIVELRLDRLALPGPALTLTFRPSLELADGECEVTFEHVSDLRILDLNWFQASVFLAEEVGHWQHEGVKYSVRDNEDEVIAFKCLRWRISA